MVMRLWHAYSRSLQKYPLLTQMVSTGILSGTGDMIAQVVCEGHSIFKRDYVYIRTVRFFCLGTFFVAPTLRVWYNILERYVNITRYPKLTPLARVVIDQASFSPIFLSSFLIALRITEGATIGESLQKWRHDFLDIFKTGLKVWPLAQLFNFYLVPLQHRIFVVQLVALFWNTYLAWKTNLVYEITHFEHSDLNSNVTKSEESKN